MAKRRKSPGPAHSKAQWAWMFATHRTFAHRWAEAVERRGGPKTGYRALPKRLGVRKKI